MSQPPAETSNQVEALLAVVCEYAPEIRERLSGRPLGAELVDTVLDQARVGQDTTDSLRILNTALVALGEPQGLRGYLGSASPPEDRDLYAVGIDRPRPARAGYGCPRNRCAREWEPHPAEAVPSCHVDGARLVRARGA